MFVVGDHAAPVYSLAFSPAGGTLAGAGKDGTARLWDLAGGPAIVLNGHTDAVLSVAFHPDGTQVATGSADRTARLGCNYRKRTVPPARRTRSGGGAVACRTTTGGCSSPRPATASTPPNRAACGCGRLRHRRFTNSANRTGPGPWPLHRTAKHWPGPAAASRSRSGRSPPGPADISAAQDRSWAIALSADGRTLAATDDWSIRLWTTADKQEQTTLVGHKGRVSSLAFSPDGRILASGGWDKRVTFWDVGTGQARQTYEWGRWCGASGGIFAGRAARRRSGRFGAGRGLGCGVINEPQRH